MFFPLSSTVPGWGSQRRPCCCGQTPLKLSRVSPDPVAGTVRCLASTRSTSLNSGFRKMETNSSPKASNPMTMWPHCAATELHFGVLEVLLKHQSEILYTDCCNRLHSDARLPCSAVHRDGPRSLVTLKANVQLYGCKNEIHLSGCNGSRMHEVQLCVQRMPRIVQRNAGKRAI
jgi:hypothetical protein